MSNERLVEIEARIAAASPHPWTVVRASKRFKPIFNREDVFEVGGNGIGVAVVPASKANADMLAHAPEDLVALIAEVRRLRVVTA